MGIEPADDEWRQRLRQAVGDHGGPTAVARLAEMPLQTLKNHLNGRTRKPPLNDLRRIAEACGVSAAWLMVVGEDALAPVGFREGDVAPYDGPVPVVDGRPPLNHGRWRIKSRVLELAGYLPGDIVEFDLARKPKPGEPVVAQIYDDTGGAETVLRLYRPPSLISRSFDSALDARPIALDPGGERVKIMGGFVRMVRQPG